jgi:hypothetical protein
MAPSLGRVPLTPPGPDLVQILQGGRLMEASLGGVMISVFRRQGRFDSR